MERYGHDRVRVLTSGDVQADVCTRSNCGPPWRGGLKIVKVGNFSCTSGFVVRKNLAGGGHTYGLWTAGHCGTASWRQGSTSGVLIGTTSENHFVNNSTADVQVIPINASNKTNTIIDDTAGCNPCTLRGFTGSAQQAGNADEFGDVVCSNGYVTGKSCGTIASIDVDAFPYLGNNLFNQRRATYGRNAGDSGGPVYTTVGSKAAGSHVHFLQIGSTKYPIYSHVFEMSVRTNYFVWNGV